MDSTKLYFSRFTHKFVKNGVVALFNALRLRPVYLTEQLYTKVLEIINSEICVDGRDLVCINQAIQELKKNRIIIDNPDYDDLVLKRFQKLTGKPAVRVAYFIMTDKCNFNCSYCFMLREQKKGNLKVLGKMSNDTAELALKKYAELSYSPDKDDERIIIFYGGEPLLNYSVIQDVVFKAEQLKKDGILANDTKFAIVTNGSLLTDDKAQFFKEHDVGIGISVDGDSFVNDSSRKFINGTPTFASIMRAIEVCKRNNCDDFSLSVTISEKCLDNFDSTIDFIVNRVGCKNVGYNILMNDSSVNQDDYATRASEFLIKSFEIFRKKGIYEDRMMRKVKSLSEGKVHLFDCAACGANQVVFAPDGSIGVCHGFLGTRNYFSGTVHDRNFKPETNVDFIEWSKRAPVNMKDCFSCPAIGICGGGCPFNAFNESKSIWNLDKRFCVHSKMSLEWLIWDLYESTRKSMNKKES